MSNKAAENVTKEIPQLAAVAGCESAALDVDYFPELGSQVMGVPAWGLIAACLGKMTKRRSFAERFWWGGGDDAVAGMKDILVESRGNPARVESWEEAVACFRRASHVVAGLAEQRQSVADALASLDGLRDRVAEGERRCEALSAVHQQAAQRAEQAHRVRWRAHDHWRTVEQEIDRHTARQPNFWVSLSTFFRAGREWDAERRRLDALSAQREAEAAHADRTCRTSMGGPTRWPSSSPVSRARWSTRRRRGPGRVTRSRTGGGGRRYPTWAANRLRGSSCPRRGATRSSTRLAAR